MLKIKYDLKNQIRKRHESLSQTRILLQYWTRVSLKFSFEIIFVSIL